MNRSKGAVVAAVLALAYAESAAAVDGTGFYVGAGLGESTVENDDEGIDFDENDTGFKIFGGFQFNKYLGAELAYIDLGEPEQSFIDNGTFAPAGTPGKAKIDISQINLSVIGTLPFNDYFGAMGRLGASYVDASLKVTSLGSTLVDDDDNTTAFSYGVGLWVAPAENLLLRLEYEMTAASLDDFSREDVDLTLISLSAIYRFGG